jgi:hypothetical protein
MNEEIWGKRRPEEPEMFKLIKGEQIEQQSLKETKKNFSRSFTMKKPRKNNRTQKTEE